MSDYTKVLRILIKEVFGFGEPHRSALLDSLQRNGDLLKFADEYPKLESDLTEPAGNIGLDRDDAFIDILTSSELAYKYYEEFYREP